MMKRRTLLAAWAAPPRRLDVRIDGQDVTSFYFGAEWDKPFLYPLRTVSGQVLSRRYPVETSTGEQTDHAWHRGLWWGHGLINGQDFWREQGHDKTSRLIVQPGTPKLLRVQGNPAVAAVFDLRRPDGHSLGSVGQEFTFSHRGALRFIDAHLTVIANQGEALTFGDTDDGGFAFRLNEAFRQDRGARLRNSSGLETTEKIWGQPARWIDYSAVLNGVPAGVAVFDHPANPRYPTAWHARGYSLCAANPFATRSFSRRQGPDGSFTLPAGQTLQLRYRVVIHAGPCEPPQLEQLHRDWSAR